MTQPEQHARIIALHHQHPDWSQVQLAAHLKSSQSYVSQVLRKHIVSMRRGAAPALARPANARRNNQPPVDTSHPADTRRMVAMDGPTHRAIRDHAEAVGIPFDTIAARLLRVAVTCGDLETNFPAKEASA